ncbi:glycoside hydrolase family 88 protein [candidate division KSB1 bacterium]|nr:glycoside hydrolase family 88 protein [candidate division KSB1 bacterium]
MKIHVACIGLMLLINIAGIHAQEKPWSVRMAESVMTRHPQGYGGWDYVTGTVLRGFEELWRHTGDEKYYHYIKKTVDLAVTSSGSISDYRMSDYNLDEINEGRMVLLVYKETQQDRYKTAVQTLRRQLQNHPRISKGGFWHKQRYPDQMWLDGLYMGCPFYAEYCVLFDEPENTNQQHASSGVYYMILQTGSLKTNKKIIYLK